MKKIFLALLLCFVVLGGCITLPVRLPPDEKLEQWEYKYFSYLNRLDQDFWSRVSNCVVYIIIQPSDKPRIQTILAGDYKQEKSFGVSLATGLVLGPILGAIVSHEVASKLFYEDRTFEHRINAYFKPEGSKTEDHLFKSSQEEPLLPSNIHMEYVILTMEDLLRTDWKEADAYVVLDLGGMMVPKDTGSLPKLKLILITKITVIPKNSVSQWKEFRTHLEQVKKTEIIKERRKAISENKVPDVYEEVVIKSTGYFDKKTWASNNGKFFIEQFQDILASLTERLRQKLSFK